MGDSGYNRMLLATIIVIFMNLYYLYYTFSFQLENEKIKKNLFSIHQEKKRKSELGCLYRKFNETKNGKCPYSPEKYEYWPRIPHLCVLTSNSCSIASHFFGETKFNQFSWSDVIFFDFFFTKHSEISNIIEIESSTGIQSLYFGIVTKLRHGNFLSFNKHDNRLETVKKGWIETMEFKKMNKEFHKSSKFSQKNLLIVLHEFNCKFLTNLIPSINSKHYFIILPKNFELFKCLPNKKFQLKYEKFGSYFGSSYQILTLKKLN